MTKAMLVSKDESVKTIALPFAGFYESIYINDVINIDDMLENEPAAEFINDSINYDKFENLVMLSYVEYLQSAINDYLPGVTLANHAPIVRKYAGGTVGVQCDINANLLPDLETIAAAFGDSSEFKQSLIDIASSRLTSYDGFSSFYSPNIAVLFDAPLVNWAGPYIECLFFAIVAAMAIDTGASNYAEGDYLRICYDWEINHFYSDHLNSTGGIELFIYDCLNIEDLAIVNAILEDSE